MFRLSKKLKEEGGSLDTKNNTKLKKKKNLNTTEFFTNQIEFLRYNIIRLENKQFADSIKNVLDIRIDFNGERICLFPL